MSVQGQLLDITIVGCRNLKDTELFSRQDPYVIVHYAGNKYRTKTDTDGGCHPDFNERFMIPLIDGLHEFNVAVWNSNTFTPDDFIGSGKILLHKALSDGYHDSTWPLTTSSGRRAGEIRVILHYTRPSKGAHKETSVQPQTIENPVPPMYPPSNPPQYPPPTYVSHEHVYYSHVPYPPCHNHGAHGAQVPYMSYPYPPPLYPSQGGYGGYGAAPPARPYYPPPY